MLVMIMLCVLRYLGLLRCVVFLIIIFFGNVLGKVGGIIFLFRRKFFFLLFVEIVNFFLSCFVIVRFGVMISIGLLNKCSGLCVFVFIYFFKK